MRCFVSDVFFRDAAGTKRGQGFILLPLLLCLMVCSGIVLCYGRSVYREVEADRDFLCRKQMETIAQSFMFTALQQEKETEITNAVYNLNPLQPGNVKAQIYVAVNRVKDLGMRFLKVTVSDTCTNDFSLRQCGVFLPDFLVQQFTESPLIVTRSAAQGESEEKETYTITSKSDGAVFPQFSVEEIAAWASTDFPSALELQRDGLSGWIYICRNELSLPKGLRVSGDGILAFTDHVTVGDNVEFTGRVIILADRNLYLGSNVKFEKALLLCRGKLTAGKECMIKGAVMAQQDALLEDTAEIIFDREVLNPFNSIISY